MLDIFGLGLGLGLLAYLLSPDQELDCIKKAAKGEQVDIHELALAYWNKYSATHVPKSEWLTMNRPQKSQVLAKREEFERLFANFDPAVRVKVQSVRPRDVGAPQSNRIAETLSKITVSGNETVGTILNAGEQYGFIRPRGSVTSYFFHTSDVLGGIKTLAAGDPVRFVLGENQKGLCGKSISKLSMI